MHGWSENTNPISRRTLSLPRPVAGFAAGKKEGVLTLFVSCNISSHGGRESPSILWIFLFLSLFLFFLWGCRCCVICCLSDRGGGGFTLWENRRKTLKGFNFPEIVEHYFRRPHFFKKSLPRPLGEKMGPAQRCVRTYMGKKVHLLPKINQKL